MPLPIHTHVTLEAQGLIDADRVLIRTLDNALDALGQHLQRGVRGRVRYFTGREKRGVKYQTGGRGLNRWLQVFGELVQHWIDELGLPPGTFPPFGVGSLIYRWAERKGRLTTMQERAGTKARRRARRVSHVASRRPGSRPTGTAGGGTAGKRGGAATRPATGRAGHSHSPAAGRPGRGARAVARERSTRRTAFLVARAIFERGIKPGRPFAMTMDANRRKILTDIRNAFARAINQINRGRGIGPA